MKRRRSRKKAAAGGREEKGQQAGKEAAASRAEPSFGGNKRRRGLVEADGGRRGVGYEGLPVKLVLVNQPSEGPPPGPLAIPLNKELTTLGREKENNVVLRSWLGAGDAVR